MCVWISVYQCVRVGVYVSKCMSMCTCECRVCEYVCIGVCVIMFLNVFTIACVNVLCIQTTFNGRVIMTQPTMAIFRWLLHDYIKVRSVSSDIDDVSAHCSGALAQVGCRTCVSGA